MERAVGARFEPGVRHDAGDARRRAGTERGVARTRLGVQMLVARRTLDVALVEEPLEARDKPRPIPLEARPAEPVHRDHDGELRRRGRRGRGGEERESRKEENEGPKGARASDHAPILPCRARAKNGTRRSA